MEYPRTARTTYGSGAEESEDRAAGRAFRLYSRGVGAGGLRCAAVALDFRFGFAPVEPIHRRYEALG